MPTENGGNVVCTILICAGHRPEPVPVTDWKLGRSEIKWPARHSLNIVQTTFLSLSVELYSLYFLYILLR